MYYRSYLYAVDLAIWLWTILFRGQVCRPYNVGSDQEITIADLAGTVASVLSGSVESLASSALQLQPSTSTRNSSASLYVPSIERITSELELEISISLVHALIKTHKYSKVAN
jgi:dTDP-glucose 4,6-dehydratase